MRVLHVIAPVSFGGGESLLVNLLRERRPDLDETVVSLYHAPEFEQRLQAIGIPTWLLRNTSIGAGVSRRRVLFETPMNLCLAPKLWRVISASGDRGLNDRFRFLGDWIARHYGPGSHRNQSPQSAIGDPPQAFWLLSVYPPLEDV